MASVLLVVGNVTLSTGDQLISDLLDGTDAASSRTDTVEVRSHSDPPANFDSYGLIIVSETSSSGTINTNYSDLDTEAKPLMVLENGNFDEFRLSASPTSTTTTTAFLADGTHHIAAGETEGDNETFITAGEATQDVTADIGTGADLVWAANSNETDWRIWAYETAASMTSGTAPARRVAFGYKDPAVATFTTIAKNVFIAAVEWLLGEDAGGGDATVTPAATGLSFTIPQATAVSPATTSPAATALSTTQPQVSPEGAAVTLPAAIATSVGIDTPTTVGPGLVTPDTLVTTATVEQVTAGSPTTVEPDTLATSVVIPAASPSGAAVTEPAVIALSVVIPQATPDGGDDSATVTPDAIALSATPQQVTVSGSAVVTPDALTTTITIPAVSVAGEGKAEPQAVALVVTIPTVSLVGGAVVTPSTIAVVLTLPSPIVFEGQVVHIPGDTHVELNPSTTYVTITPHLNQVLLDPSATFVTVDASESKA